MSSPVRQSVNAACLAYSISIRTCPLDTFSPAATRMALTAPSCGEAMRLCIFMASRITSGTPFLTFAPTVVSMRSMTPGITAEERAEKGIVFGPVPDLTPGAVGAERL